MPATPHLPPLTLPFSPGQCTVSYQLPALLVPSKLASSVHKQAIKAGHALHWKGVRNIHPATDPNKKIVLLEKEWDAQNDQVESTQYKLTLDYSHWSAHEVLHALLPRDANEEEDTIEESSDPSKVSHKLKEPSITFFTETKIVLDDDTQNRPRKTPKLDQTEARTKKPQHEAILPPSAFETIGHIAHLNLKKHHEPYKKIIGQVILDKNQPRIKTVINKLDSIDTTFRFFQMEVLAGVSNFIATVSEASCNFTMDFSKVYWNTRLSTVHSKLVAKLSPGEYIADVMAGIGPFAIPAGKGAGLKQIQNEDETPQCDTCAVWANDLNPESYKWLQYNIEKNKVQASVLASNLDGREFIRRGIELLQKEPPAFYPLKNSKNTDAGFKYFSHYIMNLPALALEFIDAFVSLLTPYKDHFSSHKLKMPLLHVYTFSASATPQGDIIKRIREIWSLDDASELLVEIEFVRKVSPRKSMWKCEIVLPWDVAMR